MSQRTPEKESDLNASVALALALAIGMGYGVYAHFFHILAFVWRMLKIAQMFTFFAFENLVVVTTSWLTGFQGWGFKEGLYQILELHYTMITPEYIGAYDSIFGNILKWPFALALIYLGCKEYSIRSKTRKEHNVESMIRAASKVHPHLRRIVPPNFYDKLMGYSIGWMFPKYKERLEGENPCDYSHDFNFENRSDYENRYAMGISPYEMLTANPPLGVTLDEIERDKEMQKETGFVSNFRPICYFYYCENPKDSTIEFCSRTATISLERLLLCPLPQQLHSEDKLARLFDDNGKTIPIEYVDKQGNEADKFKRGGAIIGGFRPTTLLNDGVPYAGSIEDTILLFNGIERKVLTQLKEKMDGKTTRTFEEILYAMVTKKHAYSTTVIWALMLLFKDVNRIAGNEFTWVTKHDRNLGMVLQSIGRETPFLEASGTRSHFLMERKAGFRMTIPSVLGAVQDLHINAERILTAGKKGEDLLNMDEDEFSRLFDLSEIEKKADGRENEAKQILKSLGVDIEKDEKVFNDPYENIPELMKQYKEVD
ncbi:hypothetical protein E4T16_15145 [Vibrio parahaemolyticus]|nr:hypothetical protein [Vibrio parahaemolyticus]